MKKQIVAGLLIIIVVIFVGVLFLLGLALSNT
jgi:hypothetical protein